MPRMLDLIRNSEVPASLMQSAARGSLSVTREETLEILVYLSLHHKLFGQQARLTLAGWDEKACLAAAQDPATSAEVLKYWASLENLRASLLPALLENPSVAEQSLQELATQGTRPVVDVLLASPRVMNSPKLLTALRSNTCLRPTEVAAIEARLAPPETSDPETPAEEADIADEVVEGALHHYLTENAAEVEAEKDKPFRAILGIDDKAGAEAASQAEAASTNAARTSNVAQTTGAPAHPAQAAAAHAKAHAHPAPGEKRDSTLQKIARLDVKGRIALAVRGSKEERSILIRDGTKLVALAVLDSPKVSDGEVEGFAQQKNVLEAVLRTIPLKRRFAKNYSITRNLVYNPRTPIDLSLGLVKHLLTHDLKNLAENKEVSETIRKVALRLFKQKMEKRR